MADMHDLHNQLKRTREEFEREKRNLPIQIGNAGTRMFVDNFRTESFQGEQWKQVKRREAGTPEFKYPKKKGLSRRNKGILNLTGKLRRAVNSSLFTATWERIYWRVASSYGGWHNYGGTIDGRPPKRKFIGGSPQLKTKILSMLSESLRKTFATR